MSPKQRQQLQAILQTFDEAGLIALSNRGLVRRAHKDLEAVEELIVEETPESLRITGPDWVVTMPPAGPAAATDDTPATGITRQILTATLWLRDRWPDAASDNTPAPTEVSEDGENATLPLIESLSQLTWNQLSRWSGAATLREAIGLLPDSSQVVIEPGTLLRVSFPEHDVEVRFLPLEDSSTSRSRGIALLEASLSTAPQVFHRRWVTLAVLAVRRAWEMPLHPPEESTTAPLAGLPRSRSELLVGVDRLLNSMVSVGLSHPSDMMLQRLMTLSVSCVGAHLPRLARLLRGLATEIQLQLDRHARSNSARLLDRVAFAAALTEALHRHGDSAPISLAGRHRTQYDHVGTLNGVGCGAYPWRAASGFEGLQLVLWDQDRKRFWTWTASRPVAVGGVNFQSLYASETVWSGGVSPCTLSRSNFQAEQVQANHLGRLSTSQKTTLVRHQPRISSNAATDTEGDQLADFGERGFDNWDRLRDYARSTTASGLQEADPSARIVVLYPHSWGPRLFLELEQRLSWTLLDSHGEAIDLSIPWTTLTEETIECVEALQPVRDGLHGVVGIVDHRGGQSTLFPIAFLSTGTRSGDRLINPAFDWDRVHPVEGKQRPGRRQRAGSIPSTLVLDDQTDELADRSDLPNSIARRLAEVDRLVLRLAESGGLSADAASIEQARALSTRISEAGLTELAASLASLTNAMSNEGASISPSRELLRIAYLCRMYREAAV